MARNPADDPLLAALVYLSAHYGYAKSADALIAGIPYDERGMTPPLFVRAAPSARLRAQADRVKKIREIPKQALPCVIIQNAAVLILLEMGDSKAKIWDAASGTSKTVSLSDLQKNFIGTVIYVRPERAETSNAPASNDWFRQVVGTNNGLYGRVLLSAFLINTFALISPIYTMNVYDRVIPNAAVETGWALAIGALVVFAVDFIIRTLRAYFIDFAGKRIDIQITRMLYDQILNMKLAGRPNSSGAFANMLREFDGVRDFMTSATLLGLVDLPFAALFVTMIFILGGEIGGIVLFLVALSLALSLLVQIPLKKHVQRALKSAETRHGLLVETIYGLETLKTAVADGRLRARYADHVAESAEAGMESRYYSALGVNAAILIQQVAVVLIVLVGTYLIADGAMTTGVLIACVMLSSRALGPITQTAQLMTRYHQTMASLRTLNHLMQQPIERPASKDFLSRPDLKGDITFDRVSFSYPNGGLALDGVSFAIKAGEKVGIIGRIGSGKSTILRLMLKLYDPESGRILIDGADSQQIDPADLRRRLAFITQDIVLFQGTIRSNIAAANPHASETDILAAAKAAGAHDFIAAHPMGYDAPVGERGEGLSGGQKQCIALARALLTNPSVLVCDEPTNAMDMQAEENFAKLIRDQAATRTLVLVTHRMSLLPLVNRLIVIDHGKVVLDGARDMVLKSLSDKGGKA